MPDPAPDAVPDQPPSPALRARAPRVLAGAAPLPRRPRSLPTSRLEPAPVPSRTPAARARRESLLPGIHGRRLRCIAIRSTEGRDRSFGWRSLAALRGRPPILRPPRLTVRAPRADAPPAAPVAPRPESPAAPPDAEPGRRCPQSPEALPEAGRRAGAGDCAPPAGGRSPALEPGAARARQWPGPAPVPDRADALRLRSDRPVPAPAARSAACRSFHWTAPPRSAGRAAQGPWQTRHRAAGRRSDTLRPHRLGRFFAAVREAPGTVPGGPDAWSWHPGHRVPRRFAAPRSPASPLLERRAVSRLLPSPSG